MTLGLAMKHQTEDEAAEADASGERAHVRCLTDVALLAADRLEPEPAHDRRGCHSVQDD